MLSRMLVSITHQTAVLVKYTRARDVNGLPHSTLLFRVHGGSSFTMEGFGKRLKVLERSEDPVGRTQLSVFHKDAYLHTVVQESIRTLMSPFEYTLHLHLIWSERSEHLSQPSDKSPNVTVYSVK